jgi:MFS transporter, DHA1 family, multidrug resistance protein
MLLGPLLGGVIADVSGNLRAPFFASGLSILLIAPAIFLVPRSRPAVTSRAQTPLRASPVIARDVNTLIVALLLAQCAIMSLQPIISLEVSELTGDRPDIATLSGLAFSVLAFGGLIASPWLGHLGERFGTRRLLIAATVVAGVLTCAQALAPGYKSFVGTRFIAGFFVAAIIPTINVLIGRRVESHGRGAAYGLSAGAAFMGAFLGPAGGGLIAAHFGLTSVFLVSGALLVAGAFWIRMRLSATI